MMAQIIAIGVALVLSHLSTATGNRLQLLDDCICQNYNITFQCTTVGGGITVWQGTAFQCPQSSNEIILRHAQFLGSVGVCNDGAICAHADSIPSPYHFVSNLTVHVIPGLEGQTITCEHDDGTTVLVIGSFVLNITKGPLPGPLNVILVDASPSHLTFSWTPISNSCRVQSYVINSSNCGVCPRSTNLTTAHCTAVEVPAECTFTVRTVICDSIVSTVGTEISFMLQVPPPPRIINSTLCYSSNNSLSRIVTAFMATSSNVTIADTINGSTTSYTITYTASTSGSMCGSHTILASLCTNGICIQEFDTATSSCFPSTDIIIKVFASNIFGNGPSSDPTIKDGTNNFVRVEAQSDRITCTFLNVQDGEQSCSIVYGYDCQHLNSEMLTGQTREGNSVIVPLLENTEVYCYLVTAISGDTNVNIMGNFKAEVTSVHRSKITLTVAITVVIVITLVAVFVLIFSFLVWYRISSRSYNHQHWDPPTFIDLCKMSTIYDPDNIPKDTDAYTQASQEEYGITYMDIQMMKTDDD